MKSIKSLAVPLIISCLTIAVSLFTTGCASIVHSGERVISVNSAPQGATLTVIKKGDTSGSIYVKRTTPAIITLVPRAGYFRGQAYELKLELAGYNPVKIDITPTLSGWYLGNIIFGGLIGMLVVDPMTGAMWDLSPDDIQQTLTPNQASIIKNKEGFVVVLVSSLTEDEKAKMVRIR